LCGRRAVGFEMGAGWFDVAKARDFGGGRGRGFWIVLGPGNEEVRGGSTVRLRAPGRAGRMMKWAGREELVRVDWVGTN
jgi:hypothetical protein